MKNRFKKIVLLCTALAMNVSAFAISTGGAVVAGVGAAAGVTLLAVGIHKHRQRKKERSQKEPSTNSHSFKKTFKKEKKESKPPITLSTKKKLKKDMNTNRKETREHKMALRKLEKNNHGATSEAADHRTMIAHLKNIGADLKDRLKNL